MTQKLLNELTTGIVILDVEGAVSYMNTAAEDALGISLKRAAGNLAR